MKRSREPEEDYPIGNIDSHDGSDLTLEQRGRSAVKITGLDGSVAHTGSKIAMRCSLPPHSREALSFTTYEEFEVHYQKAHTNRCLECHRNFPSEHLLNVHFEDCHDAFSAVRREKGEHTVSQTKIQTTGSLFLLAQLY